MLPPQDYACGPAAYAAIAAALQSGVYETDQAAKVLRYYANSRQDMAAYVVELGHLSNQMNHVVREYALLADLYAQMMEKVEDSPAWDAKEPGLVLRVINLIKQVGKRNSVPSMPLNRPSLRQLVTVLRISD
ncbi:hypothetical protein [Paenibacillus sp. 1A_MP2]|uniref:hypothetical protein n=1 Tax=Paenibacillus sp. 1A_MP2 TaxID=3457495 RepID=UPI003FCE36AC